MDGIVELLNELAKVPVALTAIAAIAGAAGAIIAALVTVLAGKLIVTPFLSARDRQDREVEWRKHAIELTRMDLDRKLKSARDFAAHPLRPSILDFLANYRDLQELGAKSPKELYAVIEQKRTKLPPPASLAAPSVAPGACERRDSFEWHVAAALGLGWALHGLLLGRSRRKDRHR